MCTIVSLPLRKTSLWGRLDASNILKLLIMVHHPDFRITCNFWGDWTIWLFSRSCSPLVWSNRYFSACTWNPIIMNSAQKFHPEIQHSLYWESVISYRGTTPTIATDSSSKQCNRYTMLSSYSWRSYKCSFEIMIFTSSTHDKSNDPTHTRKSSIPQILTSED